MARGRNKNRQQAARAAAVARPATPLLQGEVDPNGIIDEIGAATLAAGETPVETAVAAPAQLDFEQLLTLWRDVQGLRAKAEKDAEQLLAEQEVMELARASVQEDRSALSRERSDFVTERDSLSTQFEALKGEEERLASDRLELEGLRADALAGFVQAKAAAARALHDQIDTAVIDFGELRGEHSRQLVEQTATFSLRVDELLDQLQQQLRDAAEARAQALAELARANGQLVELQRREALLDADIEQQVRARLRQEDGRSVELQGHIAALLAQVKDLEEQQTTWQSAAADVARAGELRDQLGRKDDVIAHLQEELSSRPSAVDVAENLDLAEQVRSLTALNQALRSELGSHRKQVQAFRLLELDTQLGKDKVETLENLVAGYRAVLDRTQEDLDNLRDRALDRSPFPALIAIDESARLLDAEQLIHGAPSATKALDLEALVQSSQSLIQSGHRRQGDNLRGGLQFSLHDLRVFLAGLASSRLGILQGISGTGKTSLPVEFGDAIGAEVRVVEVASGWREPQDLIGYYNAFDRRFVESESLKFLYEASTPSQEDRVHLLVLDEMNLSHPEQYFSDFLSVMERRQISERLLDLRVPAGLAHLPEQLTDGRLRLGENVWFVGTINRDETTVAVADKTYDRAHVMELPTKPPELGKARQVKAPDPVTTAQLTDAFAEARKEHSTKGMQVVELVDALRLPLAAVYDIGWGNRLDKIARRFVPVYVAAGGSTEDAADHLIATKVMSKVESRQFDYQESELESLRDLLVGEWQRQRFEGTPDRCIDVIERTLAKKQRR